ncbi:MAG: winged helix-turn-helix transcriptional regulator [Elusimicrobiota bacterium]
MDKISAKEHKVIESIHRNSNGSQRDIAHDVGVSLGLTNILINRLIKEGYIKVSRLDARKVKYIITPSGLKEKARKSYRFMKRSLSVINELKGRIVDYMLKKYEEGCRKFVIIGKGELSDITELVINSLRLEGVDISIEDDFVDDQDGIVFLNTARKNGHTYRNQIDIWKEAEKLYGRSYEI